MQPGKPIPSKRLDLAGLLVLAVALVGGFLGLREALTLAREWSYQSEVRSPGGPLFSRGLFDTGWRVLDDGVSVQEGVDLRTEQARRATLELEGGTTLRLASDTRIHLDRVRKMPEGLEISVRVLLGRLFVERGRTAAVVVLTDAGALRVKGSAVEIQVGPRAMRATAWRGSLLWEGTLVEPARGVPQGKQLKVPYGWPLTMGTARLDDSWQRWSLGITEPPPASRPIEVAAGDGQPLPAPPPSTLIQPAPPPPVAPVSAAPPAPGYPFQPPAAPASAPPAAAVLDTAQPTPPRLRPAVEPPPMVAPGTYAGRRAFDPPLWLTRKGLPPSLNGIDDPAFVHETHVNRRDRGVEIFNETVRMLGRQFNMVLERPITFHFVASQDYSTLQDSVLGMHRMREGHHEIYILQGQDGDDYWAVSAHEFGHGFVAEYGKISSQLDNEGFATWMEFKMHMLRGARTIARSFIDPEEFFRPEVYEKGLRKMIDLETRGGELGVFQYVTTGVEP